MPWTNYVSEYLDTNFPSQKEGIPDRSELVDEYFGHMFQSFAKTCISYTLASAATKRRDKISAQDLLISINRLFPLDDDAKSDHISNSNQYCILYNKYRKSINNRNLSKDRKILKIKNTLKCKPKHSNNSRNLNFLPIKNLIRNSNKTYLTTGSYKVRPDREIPLNVAFELEFD